jgi:hypothetical protein
MMLFILFSLLIISNNNLAMHKSENLGKFGDLFLKWVDKVYVNLQGITGSVVSQDWGT